MCISFSNATQPRFLSKLELAPWKENDSENQFKFSMRHTCLLRLICPLRIRWVRETSKSIFRVDVRLNLKGKLSICRVRNKGFTNSDGGELIVSILIRFDRVDKRHSAGLVLRTFPKLSGRKLDMCGYSEYANVTWVHLNAYVTPSNERYRMQCSNP